jgi:hypothetical protein
MSMLVHHLNTIKQFCTVEWMTPSQQHAWIALQERLKLGDVVNLYGPAGSGKTFLSWLLVKEQKAAYALTRSALPMTEATSSLVIIDNQQAGRDAFRALLTHLRGQQRQQAVIITRTAIPDDCYKAALHFTAEDRLCVQQRLSSLVPDLLFRTGGTLHHLINPDLPLDTEEPPL